MLFIMSLAETKSGSGNAGIKATTTAEILVTLTAAANAAINATTTGSTVDLTLTLDSPANGATLTSATVSVSWSLVGETQYSYRLWVLADDDATVVYDSGVVVSATEAATIPAGVLQTGEQYYIYVDAVSTPSGLAATSDHHLVTTDFATSQDVLNAEAVLTGNRCTACEELPGVTLSWDPVVPSIVVPVETFVRYNVRRREAGAATWTTIATIDDRLLTTYFDATGSPGIVYEYSITWEATTAIGDLVSNDLSPTLKAQLEWDWPVLHLLSDTSRWACLRAFDVTVTHQQQVRYERAWGREEPTAFYGEQSSHLVRLSLLPRYRRDPAVWEELRDLLDQRETLVFRSGIDKLRLYVTTTAGLGLRMRQLDYTGEVSLQEVYVNESAV